MQQQENNHITLTAKSLKAVLVLNPSELLTIPTPEGKPRCSIRVEVSGRVISADLNAKSLRRAIVTIHNSGVDNVAVVLQGRLDGNNALLDAGLSVQLKAKPEPSEA